MMKMRMTTTRRTKRRWSSSQLRQRESLTMLKRRMTIVLRLRRGRRCARRVMLAWLGLEISMSWVPMTETRRVMIRLLQLWLGKVFRTTTRVKRRGRRLTQMMTSIKMTMSSERWLGFAWVGLG